MCGIAGGIWFDGAFVPSERSISLLAGPLGHRGPDAAGCVLERFGLTSIGLAHTRLRIIDLSEGGNQPMRSVSGQSIIVYNGEIYNYRELREELRNRGWHFRSESDTEVILNGFEAWGIEELLRRLDGMFAFGLYSIPRDRFYLARDPFGKKPCYYFRGQRGEVVFSSDIRSFKAIGIDLHIDCHSLGYFFQELSTPRKDTIWREIKKVPAGMYLEATREAIRLGKYWTLRYSSDNRMSRGEVIEATEDLLTRAVKKRLVADVRVAALLSGGMDSSLVVALMAQVSGVPVETYSVGFVENGFNELPFARLVAERYATNHHELMIDAREILDTEALIREYGEPFADSSMVPTYLIAKAVAKSEKVLLGGDGGDEMFGGYHEYEFCNRLEGFKRLGAFGCVARALERTYPTARTRWWRQLLGAAGQPRHRLLDRNVGFSREETASLIPAGVDAVQAVDREHEEVWREYARTYDHLLIQALSGSLHTRLVNDYLVKIDRASMYASIEMRSPFLDRELAAFAATLKPDQLFADGRPKSILKDLGGRYLPRPIIRRPKSGFSVPISEWFRGPLRQSVRDVVLGGRQDLVPMNYGFVERLIGEHEEGTDHGNQLWALYVFHVWARTIGSGGSVCR